MWNTQSTKTVQGIYNTKLVNLSEIYIETNFNIPELTEDQDKVHNEIFSIYSKLFTHKECNNNMTDIKKFLGDVNINSRSEIEN